MAGIFNLFGDSTRVKPLTVSGSADTNINSVLKSKSIGAPGSTPGKIFGQKSKGLSIRSSSDLNINSPSPQLFAGKKNTAQAEKFTLKPFEIFDKPSSPLKKKSPTQLKSPQKQFKTLNSAFVVSSDQKIHDTEKSQEFVFKKPAVPQKHKKLDMHYPEPESLASNGDIEFDMFDLTSHFAKSHNNQYFNIDEDEGFISDNERVPIVQEEDHKNESISQDMEVELPHLDSFFDFEISSN